MFFCKKRDNEAELKKLKKENLYLKIENIRLKNELKLLNSFEKKENTESSTVLFEKQIEKENLFSKKHYFAYVVALMRSSSLFKIYSNFVDVIRKYSFIKISIKVIVWILILLQSGAIFVLSASAFLVSLPVAIFISYAVFFITFISEKRAWAKLKKMIEGKKVFFIFPTQHSIHRKNSFFHKMVHCFAQENGNIVIIVSPFFLNPSGFKKNKKFFMATRTEDKNILIIRRHCYFFIKKRLLKNLSNTIEIY